MTSNHFIIKTLGKGVKLLTINDLKSKLLSIKFLLEAEEDRFEYNDSL